MRKTVIAAALGAAAALPGLANAQTAAPQSPHTLTGNMAIVSDYRFRGISQTFVQPAIQGGIDYSHASGFYVGNWNSSVSGLSYPSGAGIEMDFYGGFKKAFGDFTFDIGLLQYYYPKAVTPVGNEKFDTLEGYLAVSWKWLTAKYSSTLTDYFGVNSNSTGTANGDSKGSGYFDLTASYEVAPKLTLVGHYGMQTVKNYKPLEYNDWKLGVSYDMNGWVLGAAYVGTDADETIYVLNGKETGKDTVVLSVSKTF
jgi:uncharacterized protein (TIGR02001 family)